MADRTVRAIFDAKVDGARKGIASLGGDVADAGKKVDGLTKDLKTLDGQKVDPEIDLQIDDAKKRLNGLMGDLAELKSMEASPEVDLKIEQTKAQISEVRSEIKSLTSQKYEVRVDAAIKEAQGRVQDITRELGDLRTMDATVEVEANIREAQKRLRDARAEVRELNAAKATVKVDADTSAAESGLAGLADDAGAAGAEGGDAAGKNMVSGIIGSLKSIPIAGAVVGVGVAIAGGLILGIKQGLQVEAGRDLFGARTGLDAATSAKFGRAAGEAYSQAWGDSVADNLETARVALEQGLLDSDATAREAEQIIASLSGVSEIMQEEIPAAARAAGQMIKTGLADSASEAFDVLVAGYQNGANASHDLLDTFEEYSVLFGRLGIDATEATGLMIQGLEGGAFNADKTADALKEFQIRATDASEASAEGFAAIGLNAEEMTAKIAAGGEGAREGLGQVLEGLNSIEDPVKRNAAGIALFGTQWEDMGDAINNLDLSTAASELGGLDEVTGAASQALQTLSDNAARDIEKAKRNIEVGADGIKAALAAAFSDEISSAADWVSRNRAPMMQFFVDMVQGALTMAGSFAESGATVLDSLAAMADSMSMMLLAIPGMSEAGHAMGAFAESARNGADTLRTEVPAALAETSAQVSAWAAPALMQARVHDATAAMSADMDTFSAAVDAAGGTIEINGDTVTAEQALDLLVNNINGEDGTVTINGDRVPADSVLSTLMRIINDSSGDVTIGGEDSPGRAELRSLVGAIDSSQGVVGIGGDSSDGRASTRGLIGYINTANGQVTVSADTWAAEQEIIQLTRPRSMTLSVRVAGVNSIGGMTRYDGGWLPGLNDGGYVPGPDVGYDNVLWPLHSGGRTMQQPLAGGEYVVNSADAAFWGPALEWMNSGGRPRRSSTQSMAGLEVTGTLDTPWGPAQVRGIVKDEMTAQARSARVQRSVR